MRGILTALAICCAGAVSAQDAARGYLVLGAGYSARYKSSVGAELVGKNLFNGTTDLRFGGQVNDLGHQWTAEIARRGPNSVQIFGRPAELTLGVSGETLAWDDALFYSQRLSVYANLRFTLSPTSRLDIKAEIYSDKISDISANASPLVAGEAGRVNSSGLSLTYSAGTLKRRSGSGGFVQLDAYGLTGTAQWAGLSAGYETHFPIGQVLSGRIKVRAGAAKGLNGYDLRITDRAFLSASELRGFAFGGVGPIDTNGTAITSLGGRKYATSSFEVGREILNFDRGAVFLAAFWDVGMVWDLPATSGGFGPIDDGAHLRQSAGLAIDLETNIGMLSLAYGKPLRKRPQDRLQELSLTFQLGF